MWREAKILSSCDIESATIFTNIAIEHGFEFKVEDGKIFIREQPQKAF